MPSSAPIRRPIRATLVGLGIVCVLAVVVGVVVCLTARNEIGARWAVDYLRRRGVEATIRLTRLDHRGIEGALVIGPARAPTLSIPHFSADFSPLTALRLPSLRAVTLLRPRLSLGYDGRRLDFGALQPLIDDALRAPAQAGPSPTVTITNGQVEARTPYGRVLATGDAVIAAGQVREADVRLGAARLASPVGAVEALRGRLSLRAIDATRYAATLQIAAAQIRTKPLGLQAVNATATTRLTYRAGSPAPFAGPVDLAVRGTAAKADSPMGQATKLVFSTVVSGAASGRSPTFVGDAKGRLEAASLTGRAAQARALLIDFRGSRLSFDQAAGRGDFDLRAAAPAAEVRIAGEHLALDRMTASAGGRARRDPGGAVTFDATGGAAFHMGLANGPATRLAARLAPGRYGVDLRPVLARALASASLSAPSIRLVGEGAAWSMRLLAPLQVREPGGGGLMIAAREQGWTAVARRGDAILQGDATLGGGGFPEAVVHASRIAVSRGAVEAAFDARVSGSAGPLHNGRLSLAGLASTRAGGVRLTLDPCADLAVARFDGDGPQPLAEALSTQVCPTPGAPALDVVAGRWRLAARLRSAALRAPGSLIAVDGGDAIVALSGRGESLAGEVRIAGATVADLSAPLRFRPLHAIGSLRPHDQAWTGAFDLALSKPAHPLGHLTLSHDTLTGEGGLRVDAPELRFTPKGLQPAAVLPGLAGLGREFDGPASASLELAWRGTETRSLAHFTTPGMALKTPAGALHGVKTDLTLTALDPLTSLPGQQVTAARLDAFVPVANLDATFSLGADTLSIAQAQATVAKGRIVLGATRMGLKPGSSGAGVVHLESVDIGDVLDALNISEAVKIEARLGGALPFSFGPDGIRFSDGRLAAEGPGRFSVNREAITKTSSAGGAGAPSPSAAQDFALQALEQMAFTELDAAIASRPQGRLGVVFHIKGRHDPPVGKAARIALVDLLRGRVFDRPLPLPKGTEVNLTLDSSLNFDELLAAYPGLSAPAGSGQVHP